ncbi:MAG TPA: hypothetical protein VF868_17215, partial [Bacteroidia bacterium]
MDLISKYFPDNTDSLDTKTALYNKERLLSFSISLLQVTLIFFIVTVYTIEPSSGIIEYAPYVVIAFVVNSFISLRFRPAFLFLISLIIIYSAFSILAGSFIVFTGLALVGICHLPLSSRARTGIMLLAGILLALFRTEVFNIPWLNMAIMYLAPMFMFRMIIYLYELKHNPGTGSIFRNLSYFFLFPNIFFLFFPIIDHKTYLRTYYTSDEKEVWQKGVRWMLRGLVHIMCYRIICFNFLVDVSEVSDLASLLQYLFSNYSLILRLSGIFHFTLGLLCMFGLNLPKAFDNYFAATGFVDLWRRINIYWRDFILKIFFYPVMFRYKKVMKKNLLAITMMSVFIITWLLHSYQLFWITGHFSVKLTDVVFWLTVGMCITVNSVLIERAARDGRPPEVKMGHLVKMIRIQAMFLFMSLMWSLWNSHSIADWLYVISNGKKAGAEQLGWITGGFLVITLIGVLVLRILEKPGVKKITGLSPGNTLFLTVPVLLTMFLVSFKSVNAHLPGKMKELYIDISNSSPNAVERSNAEVGYYDRLIEGDEESTIGIGGRSFKKRLQKNPYTNAYFISKELLSRRMKPDLHIEGLDHDFSSNSFGMRDKEYTLQKGAGTTRIALLGGSYEMGSGVSDHEVFETITEERLNQADLPGTGKVEIFNFAAGGYYLLQHVELSNTVIHKYSPDAV